MTPVAAAPARAGALSRSRRRRVARLGALDPTRDAHTIVRITGTLEFPWDMKRSLELALFRTYAVPRISGILVRTGELLARPQRRYDDTTLLTAELPEHGCDSPRRAVHVRARAGPLDRRLRLAAADRRGAPGGVRVLARGGRADGHRGRGRCARRPARPGALEPGLRAGRDALRPLHAVVGAATRDLFTGWFLPPRRRPLGARAVHALLDDGVLDAFGFPHPTPAERRLVAGVLRSRAGAQRHLPARRRVVLETAKRHRSHPAGYRLEDLGPPGT